MNFETKIKATYQICSIGLRQGYVDKTMILKLENCQLNQKSYPIQGQFVVGIKLIKGFLLLLFVFLYIMCYNGYALNNEIEAEKILEMIDAGEPVNYDHAKIIGDVNLSKIDKPINQRIRIVNSIINGSLNFFGATFEDLVIFSGTEFQQDSDFSFARFNKIPHFSGVQFRGNSSFMKCEFGEGADFSLAGFKKATFFGAWFGGDANFLGFKSRDDADFMYAQFDKDANFDGALFGQDADFYGAHFSGDSDFNSMFNRDANFVEAKFDNDVHFDSAVINRSIFLNRTKFDRFYVPWTHIREHLAFDEASFLSLVNNYEGLGWFKDADDCYYDYRTSRMLSQVLDSQMHKSQSSQLWWLLPLDFFAWISYGFGVRPNYSLIWSAILIFIFGLYFWRKKSILKFARKEVFEERSKEEAYSKENSETIAGEMEEIILFTEQIPRFYDHIYFSLETFTSGATTFIHPSNYFKPKERYVRIAIVERILGSILIALFLTAFLHVVIRGPG